jgi:hypothetical protein
MAGRAAPATVENRMELSGRIKMVPTLVPAATVLGNWCRHRMDPSDVFIAH